MTVFTNLRGSITAGKFYHDILLRPAKCGWTLYLLLIVLVTIVLSVYWGIRINSYANEAVNFFAEIDAEINFDNGKINNMPIAPKEFYFNELIILVDNKYIDLNSIGDDLDMVELPAIFIGPGAAYIATQDVAKEIQYPPTFSDTIDLEYVKRAKSMIVAGAFIGGLIAWFLIKFCESMAYILLIIAPILLFKFRRMGLNYVEAVKVGLYLVSFQILLSAILMISGLAFIWVHLLFVAFYIFFIGAYVNINLSHSKRKLFKTKDSQ